ncbi:hypothetical protein Tco_1308557, partial [Tanacetum coccineum]
MTRDPLIIQRTFAKRVFAIKSVLANVGGEVFRNAKLSAEVRYNLFAAYMRKAIVKDKRWADFKDVEL